MLKWHGKTIMFTMTGSTPILKSSYFAQPFLKKKIETHRGRGSRTMHKIQLSFGSQKKSVDWVQQEVNVT